MAGQIDGFDGIEQQIAAIQEYRYDKVGRYLTGNVAWWPRPLVVFSAAKTLDRLSAAQRQALRQAAAAALPSSMARVVGAEKDALASLCQAQRLRIHRATPDELTALRTAVQPVYDELQRDPPTKRAIAAIAAAVQAVTAEPAPVCGPPGHPPAGPGDQLDGVYTMTTRFGDDPNDTHLVPEHYGDHVFVLQAGHVAFTQHYQNSCTWGYGTFALTDARLEWTILDGGGVTPNHAQHRPGEIFVFGWSAERDTLRLTAVEGATSPTNLRLKPWHRISTAPTTHYLNQQCPPPARALG
jgi:hypothetical protein